ncbi:MAG: fatty-acyl-CoA synthase [Solirubrobacteraceae bacterium]|jgi:fatty-acyl-CoA synthase|nr:fatty-acyl-CoA synthase [Solirubrobacteraceae bacterium]
MDLLELTTRPARRAAIEARSFAALVRAGAFGLDPPRRQVQILRALRDYGPLGAAPRIAALRHPELPAIADERGTMSFAELDEQVDRLANALKGRRLAAGSSVGILCRNHRSPLIAAFAASRAGINAIWLNTAFSARQAAEVAAREGVDLLVFDEGLSDAAADIEARHGRIACAADAAGEVDRAIAEGDKTPLPRPARPGRVVLLTSGTTGTPKGAPRPEPRSLSLPGALLDRMPMRAREATVIGPPLYHGTGLIMALLSISLGSQIVLRTSFDPATLLADTERHRATTWCVVPIMLQRLLALGEEELSRHDLASLRVVFCAGSQLPADVAIRAMDLLGDVVYNLYGSTEVSVATLATPQDIRAAPASVGRPALGSRVLILDEPGEQVPAGTPGRIFVGSTAPFEGYTGGGSKETVGGLMSTGDVGHFDDQGRLHIDGRDDEMIVSGGENVFPGEVEELLVTHPAILEAAAIGVEDAEFGQRLIAFVVTRDDFELGEADVKAFVKENLARYKVPREVVFLDELPRNPTGKVLKGELAARPPK